MKLLNKVSIHEIAELAQVSIGTVDRALHNRAGINSKTKTNYKSMYWQPNKEKIVYHIKINLNFSL